MLALTSLTSCCRLVGLVRSRNKAKEFVSKVIVEYGAAIVTVMGFLAEVLPERYRLKRKGEFLLMDTAQISLPLY
jgi:hypothetical protein